MVMISFTSLDGTYSAASMAIGLPAPWPSKARQGTPKLSGRLTDTLSQMY